jgi:hypothetical protein
MRIRLKLGENEIEYEGEAQDDLARRALDPAKNEVGG